MLYIVAIIFFVLLLVCISEIIRLHKLINEMNLEIVNVEDRSLKHFKKINEVKEILEEDEKNKENFYLTVSKIKKDVF